MLSITARSCEYIFEGRNLKKKKKGINKQIKEHGVM